MWVIQLLLGLARFVERKDLGMNARVHKRAHLALYYPPSHPVRRTEPVFNEQALLAMARVSDHRTKKELEEINARIAALAALAG